ncbi:MAG: GNAT family N-acetyltransferase [Polyangia bacterium]
MPDRIADADRRRAIAHTPLRQPSPLQRYRAAPGRHLVDGDVVLCSTGGEDAEGNTVFVLGHERVERVLSLADAFFGAAMYAVAVDQDAAPALPQGLVSRGWQLAEQEPVLVLAPIPDEPAGVPGLRIQRVDSEAGFEAFLRISQTARRWIPSLQAAMDPDVALFVGCLHEEPVATSRLTRHGEVAEILGVVTLPAYRRRGLGTALTWAAMTEARRRGCTALTLTASELGYGVYRRIGFVPAGRYLTYVGGR